RTLSNPPDTGYIPSSGVVGIVGEHEVVLQQASPPRVAGFHGAGRDVEHRGDLGDGVAEHPAQHDGLPEQNRDAGQRVVQVNAELPVRCGVRSRQVAFAVADVLAVAVPAPVLGGHEVQGGAV